MINLHPTKEFKAPITAECINPDLLQSKTTKEIERLKIWEGNRQKELGQLFKVEEIISEAQLDNTAIEIFGDLSKVRRIGAQMKSGEIIIKGDAGMHLGEHVKGGKITVQGNVGGWAGSMMKGGMIEIHGNAGDYLASPYRGSNEGMHGGKIVVHGNVGNEAGAYMKKGIIKIYGTSGQFVGLRMHEGTIYVKKNCDGRAGACMTGGRLIIEGCLESVLPTFTIDSMKRKAKIEEGDEVEGPFYLFLGDLVENGEGKLYVSKLKNPHLNCYERLI